jgi:ubiquinone/menaquinone biosynthesis C-methylase UbiE
MTRIEDLYRLPEVAAVYARESGLFPPEETILQFLLPELRNARMLDLGVGGGRTTLHFAKHVREYVGADYSPSMIRECEKRFASYSHPLSFVVADARSLTMFESQSFDFILFSLNGIDSVNHADRLKILKEVHRVAKTGAWFCFSSHNLNFVPQLFAQRTPRAIALRCLYNWRVRASALKHAPYLTIHEWAHARRVLTYYIRPAAQLSQLGEHFTDVRVFSFETGREIVDQSELQNAQDMCLYYLCRIRA